MSPGGTRDDGNPRKRNGVGQSSNEPEPIQLGTADANDVEALEVKLRGMDLTDAQQQGEKERHAALTDGETNAEPKKKVVSGDDAGKEAVLLPGQGQGISPTLSNAHLNPSGSSEALTVDVDPSPTLNAQPHPRPTTSASNSPFVPTVSLLMPPNGSSSHHTPGAPLQLLPHHGRSQSPIRQPHSRGHSRAHSRSISRVTRVYDEGEEQPAGSPPQGEGSDDLLGPRASLSPQATNSTLRPRPIQTSSHARMSLDRGAPSSPYRSHNASPRFGAAEHGPDDFDPVDPGSSGMLAAGKPMSSRARGLGDLPLAQQIMHRNAVAAVAGGSPVVNGSPVPHNAAGEIPTLPRAGSSSRPGSRGGNSSPRSHLRVHSHAPQPLDLQGLGIGSHRRVRSSPHSPFLGGQSPLSGSPKGSNNGQGLTITVGAHRRLGSGALLSTEPMTPTRGATHAENLWAFYAGVHEHMHRSALQRLAEDVFDEFRSRLKAMLERQANRRGRPYKDPELLEADVARELPYLLPVGQAPACRADYVAFIFKFAVTTMKRGAGSLASSPGAGLQSLSRRIQEAGQGGESPSVSRRNSSIIGSPRHGRNGSFNGGNFGSGGSGGGGSGSSGNRLQLSRLEFVLGWSHCHAKLFAALDAADLDAQEDANKDREPHQSPCRLM